MASVARILIVEDDDVLARSTQRLLARSLTGATFVHATTSVVAIDALCSDVFDLVISDYNLADCTTGAEVLAFVRKLPAYARPAFLFVSSDERIESLGVPYLTKPVRPSELRETVQRLLNGEPEDEPKVVREMPLDGAFDLGGVA